MFFVGLTILLGFTSAISLSCISMNNQECKTRPKVVNACVFFILYWNIRCSGSFNNINYPYAKIYVPDVVKKIKC